MRANNNLIFTAIGAVLLLTLNTTTVLASDATKEDKHQHHPAKPADKKSADGHEHQCDHKMSSVDTDKDGRISREEFIKHHELMFDKKDSNKDGFLDESEMHHMMGHKPMHDHGNRNKEGGHTHSDSKK
jgi:hypothetical protein